MNANNDQTQPDPSTLPQTAGVIEKEQTPEYSAQEIYEAFMKAKDTGGPVLIAGAMRSPSHFYTVDPIHMKSPLLRLCIAAANMGIENLVFDHQEDFVAALGNFQHPGSTFCEVIAEKDVPAFYLHWCTLNAAFFDASLQRGHVHRKTSGPSAGNPNIMESTIQGSLVDQAEFDPQNEKHCRALEKALAHFQREASRFTAAANRLGAILPTRP